MLRASAVTLNNDAKGKNNDEDFFELFRDHDFGSLRKPISTHLVKCLVQQEPENFLNKEVPFAKKEEMSLSTHWFEILSSNKERFQRKRLIYLCCHIELSTTQID